MSRIQFFWFIRYRLYNMAVFLFNKRKYPECFQNSQWLCFVIALIVLFLCVPCSFMWHLVTVFCCGFSFLLGNAEYCLGLYWCLPVKRVSNSTLSSGLFQPLSDFGPLFYVISSLLLFYTYLVTIQLVRRMFIIVLLFCIKFSIKIIIQK